MLAAFPGWTWEYIDRHMTIPRMNAINKAHARTPPAYIVADHTRRMIAAYLGLDIDAQPGEVDNGQPIGYASDGTSLFDLFPS